MDIDDELSRRLRAIDERSKQVAVQRRHYDASGPSVHFADPPAIDNRDRYGEVDEFNDDFRGPSARHQSSSDDQVRSHGQGKFDDTRQQYTSATSMANSVHVDPSSFLGGSGSRTSCARCQSLDVSLNILRSNVAGVEEGYLGQIEQLQEALDSGLAERDHLAQQATMAMHEAELQHATALKRSTEVGTLRRELTRLEIENEGLHRKLNHLATQHSHLSKYSRERAEMSLLHEESVDRDSIALLESTWWSITTATWGAERSADERVAQFVGQFALKQRLEGNAIKSAANQPQATTSSSGRRSDAEDSLKSAASAAKSLTAPSYGLSIDSEKLKAEIARVDTELGNALAAEVRAKKELTIERKQRQVAEEESNELTVELFNRTETCLRSEIFVTALKASLDLWAKHFANAATVMQKQVSEGAKNTASKERELVTMRRMLMEKQDDAYQTGKKLTAAEEQLKVKEQKIAELEATLKAAPPATALVEHRTAPPKATGSMSLLQVQDGDSTTDDEDEDLQLNISGNNSPNKGSTMKLVVEASTQTSFGELDLIAQLTALIDNAPTQGRGGDISLAHGGSAPPSRRNSAATASPPPAPTSTPANGPLPNQQHQASEAALEELRNEVRDAFDKTTDVLSMKVDELAGANLSSADETHSALKQIMEKLDRKRIGEDDVASIRLTLRNLLVCVSQHQKSIHESVKSVSTTITSLHDDIRQLRETQEATYKDMKKLEGRPVPPPMDTGKLGVAGNTSGGPSPSANAAPAATAAAPSSVHSQPSVSFNLQSASQKSHHWDVDSEDDDDAAVAPAPTASRTAAVPKPKGSGGTPWDGDSD